MEPPRLQFVAGEGHFVDHLAPVWQALDPEVRGCFWVPRSLEDHARRRGIVQVEHYSKRRVELRLAAVPAVERTAVWVKAAGRYRARHGQRRVRSLVRLRTVHPATLELPAGAPAVVASAGDLVTVADGQRPLALMEHGVGQTYGNRNPSYAGGSSRQRAQVGLFLSPNHYAAGANRRAYPESRCVVVGSPRLDRWWGRERRSNPGKPVVAVSFHWDCRVVPETRGSFHHFRYGLPSLVERYRVLGHGHPRILRRLIPEYRRLGVEVVSDFEEVLERADLYAVDNSSTLFEFAATGRPVVVFNAPFYRRHVEHGLRFWSCAEVGVQCDDPEALPAAVEEALEDRPEQQEARRRALEQVLPLQDGQSAVRAARALCDWLAERSPRRREAGAAIL